MVDVSQPFAGPGSSRAADLGRSSPDRDRVAVWRQSTSIDLVAAEQTARPTAGLTESGLEGMISVVTRRGVRPVEPNLLPR